MLPSFLEVVAATLGLVKVDGGQKINIPLLSCKDKSILLNLKIIKNDF